MTLEELRTRCDEYEAEHAEELAAMEQREKHERTLERRLTGRRTVVRWLLTYPPIALPEAS